MDVKKSRNIGIGANPPSGSCADKKCPWHGTLSVRGRVFVGKVAGLGSHKTAIVRWGYNFFVTKYERYERRHSCVVAYRPDCLEIKVGDKVKIAECRPLSKTKKFVVVEVLE